MSRILDQPRTLSRLAWANAFRVVGASFLIAMAMGDLPWVFAILAGVGDSIPKYIASQTLEEPLEWNASLIRGDLAESVTGLKRQQRGNLISFGCGELANELVTQGLADEIHFWVNPAVWASGGRAFHGRQVRMRLIAATTFDSGVTLLCYRPAPDRQTGPATGWGCDEFRPVRGSERFDRPRKEGP